jgi:hypothetical protein
VQALARMAGEWCGADGSEALPGFRDFVMKQVRGTAVQVARHAMAGCCLAGAC